MRHLWRYFVCALSLLITAQVLLAQAQLSAKPAQKPINQPGEDANFQRYLTSGRISVVTFYANWCPSCRRWAPILDSINTDFPDIQVLFMDIGEWDTPVTEKYGISSVPHFKVYDRSGNLIVEGRDASQWLRQAIERRLQAYVQGTYKLTGQPGSAVSASPPVNSITTRPKNFTRTTPARASEAVTSSPEKIDSTRPLPSVDQVIDRYVEALGGKTAASKFSTRTTKGTVNIPKVGRGSFAIYAKAPNKMLMTIDIPEVGIISQGFNGVTGWTKSSRAGLRSVAGPELVALKREADFFSPLKLKTNYPVMRLLGVAKIGFREAYVIEAKPLVGEVERLYFSKENGLIIRCDAVRASLGKRTAAEVYFDNWTDIDGMKMPLTITQLFPGLSLVLILDEVKHDVPVSDDIFNRPATK